ncbi:MAG: hypothetical protein IT436_07685 [Phycisphaerales bacterium]|nr:hypothetical protein [Phycisphaerales bacterium]
MLRMRWTVKWLALAVCVALNAAAQVNIETVSVGDAGNPADSGACGAVSCPIDIGVFAATEGQYADLLSAVTLLDLIEPLRSPQAVNDCVHADPVRQARTDLATAKEAQCRIAAS